MHRLLKIDDAAGTLAYRLEGREGLAISLVLINSAMETADFDAATPTPEVSHSKSSPQTHTDALLRPSPGLDLLSQDKLAFSTDQAVDRYSQACFYFVLLQGQP